MRKLKQFLFILFLAFALSASAQEDSIQPIIQGYFSLDGNCGLPVGKFHSSSANSVGGNATTGGGFAFRMEFMFTKFHVGLSFYEGVFFNSYNLNAYLTKLQTNPLQEYSYSPLIYNQVYAFNSTMFGLFTTIPVKRFSFDFRILGSRLNGGMPAVAYSTTDLSGSTNTYDYDFGTATGGVWDFGTGVRFSITKKICTLLNVNYMHSLLHFTYKMEHVDPNHVAIMTDVSGTMPLSILNFEFGFGYQIR